MSGFRRIVAVMLVLTACGRSAMASEEYFPLIEAARADFAQANADVDDRYTAQLAATFDEIQGRYDLTDSDQAEQFALESIDAGVEVTVALLTARTEGLERYLAELGELRPPEVAADAHAAWVAALGDARDGLAPTIDAIRGVDGVGALARAIQESAVGQALVRAGEACRALQVIAAAEGQIVDLRCPDA